jgi:signal transduction histidine kinase
MADNRIAPENEPSRGLVKHSRSVLLIGFGGLLLLMAYAGFNTMRAFGQTRDRSARIQQEFVSRSRLLNQIRSQLYLSGTYVRDYLLEPDPVKAATYRTDLHQVRQEMNAAIDAYAGLGGAEETAPLSGLRAQLADYWRVLEPAMEWQPEERHRQVNAFFKNEVSPRRAAMLRLADEIGALNERQLQTSSERVAALFAQVRDRIAITLAVTLLLGLALAVVSMLSILQAERQAVTRYNEVSQARRELKELSARLVHAQENERRAISRELHDEVGQSMSALHLGLSNLLATLPEGPRDLMADQINGLRNIAEQSVHSVRNLSLLLRPSMLDDLGLVPALRWQAREASRNSGLRVDVAADEICDELPDEFKTCIYRVVQEALHNITRHAKAQVVRINVRQGGKSLLLTIQDDGRGFDTRERGLGLLGIEERVANLGGQFRVESQPGRGVLLAISFQVPQGTAA